MIGKSVFGISAPRQRHGNCHTKARVVVVTRAWKKTRARRVLVLLLFLLLLLLLSLSLLLLLLLLLFLWLLLLLIIVGAISKHRVKYELDHWTGPLDPWTIFLDYFLDHYFGPLFGPFFWTILSRGVHTVSTQGRVGYSLSVLREGWEPDCCYSGRGGRRTINTQGAVGGGCICKCYWLMEFSLDHSKCLSGSSTDYFYVKIFLAGLLPWAVLLSCERETATWTLDFIDWTSYKKR